MTFHIWNYFLTVKSIICSNNLAQHFSTLSGELVANIYFTHLAIKKTSQISEIHIPDLLYTISNHSLPLKSLFIVLFRGTYFLLHSGNKQTASENCTLEFRPWKLSGFVLFFFLVWTISINEHFGPCT